MNNGENVPKVIEISLDENHELGIKLEVDEISLIINCSGFQQLIKAKKRLEESSLQTPFRDRALFLIEEQLS